MLRSRIQAIVNWALHSDAGGSYEDEEDDACFDPRDHVCQIQPTGAFYSERISAGSGTSVRYTKRAGTMNRRTGTPHETEPNWRDRCRRTIFDDNHYLHYKNRQKQDETALALKVSTGRWVQKPGSGDTGGYRVDHNQPQYPYYRPLASMPQSDRSGGGVMAVTIA